jgi:hypothetical protein
VRFSVERENESDRVLGHRKVATTLLWQNTEFLLGSWHFRRNLLPLRSRCTWQIPAESERYASGSAPLPLPWILKPPWMRVTQPDLVSSMRSAICYVQIVGGPADAIEKGFP